MSIIPAPLPPPLCSSLLLPAPPLSCSCVITPTHFLAGRSREEQGGAKEEQRGAGRSREEERVPTGYTVSVRPLLLSNLAVLSLVSIIPAPLPPPLCCSSLLPAPSLSCPCVITPTHFLAGRSREERGAGRSRKEQGARRSREEQGGARRSREEQRRSKEEQGGAGRRSEFTLVTQ